jgi:ribose transport system permease protein
MTQPESSSKLQPAVPALETFAGNAVGTPADVADASRSAMTAWRAVKRLFSFEELGVAVALGALVLLIGAFHPAFLHKAALLQTVQSASFVAVVAYGMVFLLAMTEIDLSVGGTYAMAIIISAKLMASNGMSPWIAAILGIGLGAVLGLVNGIFAALFRLPLIIITLGTLSAYSGLVTVISNGQPVENLPLSSRFFSVLGGNWLGFPVAGWIVLLLGVVLTIVFRRTRFGAMVRAVGSNRDAATFSGIPSARIRIYALMLTGALAALSGILSLAYFQGADPTLGTGFELQVIAAAVIGGTAVAGGRGTILGALIGALIVAVINSGLIFFAIPSNWSQFVTGAVILIAVGMDSLVRRRRAGLPDA